MRWFVSILGQIKTVIGPVHHASLTISETIVYQKVFIPLSSNMKESQWIKLLIWKVAIGFKGESECHSKIERSGTTARSLKGWYDF